MTVTNINLLDTYARIADNSYDNTVSNTPFIFAVQGGGTYVEIINQINGPAGFQARAFFNETTNDLVISFAGTEGLRDGLNNSTLSELLPDLTTDFLLAYSGASPQDIAARAFIGKALQVAADRGFSGYDTTYIGHSLGGFLAQTASTSGPEGEVVVFNSPGVGGFTTIDVSDTFPEDRYTYIYSDPDEWGILGNPIHSVGERLSDNVFYVDGAKGHAIATESPNNTGLSNALNSSTMLESVEESDFIPVNEALIALNLLGLSNFLDDGTSGGTPINGTQSADMLDGTNAGEEINGLGGNDTVFARAGDDAINGGAGNDVLFGNAGDDILNGGAGNDLFFDVNGANTFNGGAGTDQVTYVNSVNGVNVNLKTGTNSLGHSYSNIENLSGSDSGNDTLTGTDGRNFIDGNIGNDILNGGAGNDILRGGDGADTLDGGAGIDTANYTRGGERISLDLRSGTGVAGDASGDTFTSIENITATVFNDYVYGNDANNIIKGFNGDDLLRGHNGDDTLFGGAGADDLNGGNGDDTASYASSVNRINVDLRSGSGTAGDSAGDTFTSIENLTGSDQDDYFYGDNGDNVLDGGLGVDLLRGHNGDDTLIGGAGADDLNGGSGTDTASYENALSFVNLDLRISQGTNGQAGGDTYTSIENVIGSDFDDYIYGDNGANVIDGGAGDDRLRGHGGNDTIIGGTGDDNMYGNNGADTFVFTADSGDDAVINFTDGVDKFRLDGGLTFGDVTITDNGTDTTVDWGTASVVIEDILAGNITQADFL